MERTKGSTEEPQQQFLRAGRLALAKRLRFKRRGALARAHRELAEDYGPYYEVTGAGEVVPAGGGPLSTCVRRNNSDNADLGEAERLTRGFREGLAARHEERAARALEVPRGEVVEGGVRRRFGVVVWRVRAGRRTAVSALEAARTAHRWHLARARGQREKFLSKAHCGQGVVRVGCGACAGERAALVGCGNRRICVRCRERAAEKGRRAFASAREAVLRVGNRLGLTRRARRGGRYTEKHVTLTVPDSWICGEGAVRWRVEVLLAAWPRFIGRLSRWARKKGERLWFFRGFEWTPGADGLGHPHFHVWFWSGFLPADVLRWFWSLALQEAGVVVFPGELRAAAYYPSGRARSLVNGRPPVTAFPVVVDVREVKLRRVSIMHEVVKGGAQVKTRLRLEAGNDLVGYVSGWCLSEVANGQRISEAVLAELYCALEGRRQTQASAGFLALGYVPCACGSCGVSGFFRVRVVPWWSLDLELVRATLGLPALARAGPKD